MPNIPEKKSIIPSVNHPSKLLLVGVILLILLSLFVGCQSRTITATINYGPFGPIELPSEIVKVLMDYLPTLSVASSDHVDKDVWPLEIKFSSGSKISMVAIYSNGIAVVDNQPRQIDNTFLSKIRKDFRGLLESISFAEVLMKCDSVHLKTDEPGLELSLDSDNRVVIGSLMNDLIMEEPESGYTGAPYPGYVLTMDWGGVSRSVVFVGQERDYIELSTYGFYGRRFWHDLDGKVWERCLSLLPPPPPDERRGITKLFASTDEVRASGGDLGQPIICDKVRAPSLIRLFQTGKESSESVPVGEPVVVTFSDSQNEWKVYLYENGFKFENLYYQLDNIKMTFLSSMNAG